MQSSKMAGIILQDAYLVMSGGRCLVYRHPDDDHLLIKVVKPKYRARNSIKVRLIRQVRSLNRYRLSKCYIRELIESMQLRCNDHYSTPTFLQQVVGLVDTNLGFGLVVKAELGSDGEYAKTLKTLIQTNHFDASIQKKLDEFYDVLAACDVVVSDCAPQNVVYAYNDVVGDHFVLIDGIGEKTLIPIFRMMPAYVRKKYRLNQIEKLKKRVSDSLNDISEIHRLHTSRG